MLIHLVLSLLIAQRDVLVAYVGVTVYYYYIIYQNELSKTIFKLISKPKLPN